MLQAYVFPGNMRELRKLLQRAVLTCRDGVMRAADLHLPTVAVPPLPGEQPLADVERAPIRALSAPCSTHMPATATAWAAALDITERTLYRKLKCYGLS